MPQPEETRPAWPPWYGFTALGIAVVAILFVSIVLVASLEGAGVGVGAHSPGVNLPLTIAQDLALVASALYLAAKVARPRAAQFGLRGTRLGTALKWMGIAVALYLVCQLVYVAAFNPHEDQTTLKDLGAGKGPVTDFLIGVLVVGVAPPIEEFFFRGFLYGALRTRFSFLAAAVIAGLAFGAVHATTGLEAVPPLAALGFALCMLYEATGSIVPGIVLHSLNNTVAFGSDKAGSWPVAGTVAVLVILACVTLPRRSRNLG